MLNRKTLSLAAMAVLAINVAEANPFQRNENRDAKIVYHNESSNAFSVRLDRKPKSRPKHQLRGENGHQEVTLLNYHDYTYTGPVFVGQPEQQTLTVVYDTGSDWLTLEGTICGNCGGNLLDDSKSDTFAYLESDDKRELNYGSATLYGYRVSDRVCFTPDLDQSFDHICENEFEFFLVETQRGLDDRVDGVLGLSRSSIPDDAMENQEQWRGMGPVLLKHLADSGSIKENLFAFYMESYADENGHDRTSFIDIGDIVESHVRSDSELVWFDLVPHMYWMVESVSAIRFGDKHIEDGAYQMPKSGPSSYRAIFDSGTSMTMIPEAIYHGFMMKLMKHTPTNVTTSKHGGLTVTNTCRPDVFPNVYFLINNYWVEMSPKDYLIKAQMDPNDHSCFIGFTSAGSMVDFIVFGDTFMRGFYVVHSDETGMVGIAPHSNSLKKAPEFEAVHPLRHIDGTGLADLTEKEIAELAAGIFSLVVIGYMIWYYCTGQGQKDGDLERKQSLVAN